MKNKRYSMKQKMCLLFGGAITTIFAIILFITYISIKKTMTSVNEANIQNTIQLNAELISENVNYYLTVAELIAGDDRISASSLNDEERIENIKGLFNFFGPKYNMLNIGFISTDAYLTTTDGFELDVSSFSYVSQLMNQQAYVSSPEYYSGSNSYIIYVGQPLVWEGKTVGAITCAFSADFLSETISDLTYLGKGTTYALNSEGTVIGSHDYEEVTECYNLIEAAKTDSSLAEIAAIQKKMIAGGSGIEKFNDGKEKMIAYATIPYSGGWSLAFEIPMESVDEEVNQLIFKVIFIMILFTLITIILIFLYANIFSKKLVDAKNKIDLFAKGDYSFSIEKKQMAQKDEFGDIFRSLDITKSSMREILVALKDNTSILQENSIHLDAVGNDVNTRSEAISESMNEAATGSTEQASSISVINRNMEKLGQNITQVNERIKDIVNVANQTDNEINVSGKILEDLNQSLEEFTTTFQDFSTEISTMSSQISEIGNITDTIKQISSQTNLLALNAAIESARAGEAGRGFAVVADEIRKLAEASEASVSEIGAIIDTVLQSGNTIAESSNHMNEKMNIQKDNIETTIQAFRKITDSVSSIIPMTTEIAKASGDGIELKNEMSELVSAVSAVSEELAATTEEVAATAEDFKLSSQDIQKASNEIGTSVNELKEQMQKFILD